MRTSVVIILLILLVHDASCQRRRSFHSNGDSRGRRNFQNHRHQRPYAQQHNFQRFPHAHRDLRQQTAVHEHEPIIAHSNCRHVLLSKQTSDRIYGNLMLNSLRGLQNEANVEVEFDRPVISFINNLSHSTSHDNRVFSIGGATETIGRDYVLNVEFFVSFDQEPSPPEIVTLKLNGQLLCPDVVASSECANLEIITNGTGGGRYDGVLTIHPQRVSNGAQKIELEFDEKSWAVGNDLGESVTNDQRRFTIFNSKFLPQQQPLTINFFVKFDEFDETVPRLMNLYVDDNFICLPHNENTGNIKRSNFQSTLPPPFNRNESDMLLTDLPFDSFPTVTTVPQLVFNEGFECGLASSVLTSRLNDGLTAHLGQFPFHVAIFFESRYRCGASLVSEKASITASHCIVDSSQRTLPVEKFHLIFGIIDLHSLSGHEALRQVHQIIKHPKYQHDKILKQDIAIIIAKGNLQFSQYVRPICLPDAVHPIENYIDKELIVVGFGSSTESLKLSRFLHYGKMKLISREKCTEQLILALLPEQSTFCAVASDHMLACPGDSGGGMIEVTDGKFYLRGIASVTLTEPSGRCNTNNPVGFTNVQSFLSFIREIVQAQSSDFIL